MICGITYQKLFFEYYKQKLKWRMQAIKDYVLTQNVSSIPTHKTYRSHLKSNPQKQFTIDLLYFKSVPRCYKSLPIQGKKLYDPFLLLKEIFHNPLSRDQIVFVETQREGLRSLASVAEGEISFERRLLLILRMIRLVPIVFANGVLHDFHADKVMHDCQGNVFLQNFTKKAPPHIGASTIEKNINDIIKTLIGKRVETEQVTDIRFQTESEGVCWLIIENCSKDEGFQSRKTIAFKFSPQRQALMYDYCINEKAVEEPQFRNITYEQLRECGNLVFNLLMDGWRVEFDREEQIMEMTNEAAETTETNKPGETPVNPQKPQNCLSSGASETTEKPSDSAEISRGHPYNLVGLLESYMTDTKMGEKKFHGTGILISEYLVITCAHNLIKLDHPYLYRLLDIKNIRFKLNEKWYKVQSYRRPDQYQVKKYINSRYDYALLKLKQPIRMPKYIQVIKDYEKSSGKLIIKNNFFQYDETAVSKSFRFEQDYIKFQCAPVQPAPQDNKLDRKEVVNKPSPGYSGSPIILVAAEINNTAKYFFMVGIYFGQGEEAFFANHFNDKNIAYFEKWEREMTQESKVFRRVFSYKTVLNMDQDLVTLKQPLDKIKFHPDEMTYFPLIWKQVSFFKNISRKVFEEMYIRAGVISQDQKKWEDTEKKLLNMGSFSEEQRYNNIIFMYSIRYYLLWHVQWFTFESDQGMFLATNYIAKRLCFFFQFALPTKDQAKADKFIEFRDRFKSQMGLIYSKHPETFKHRYRITTKFLQQSSDHMDHIPLNQNFKRLLQLSQKIALNILTSHQKEIKQLYYFPKLLMYTFIGKEWLTKLAILDQNLREYLWLINSTISICLRKIQSQFPDDLEEVTHNFLWGVRDIMGEGSVKEMLRIVDQSELSKEERAKQDAIDREVQKNYLSEQGWQFLKHIYKIPKSKDDARA